MKWFDQLCQHCIWILGGALYCVSSCFHPNKSIFVFFYSVEIWVRDMTESKNVREQYFVQMLTNFIHPLLPGLTLWTAKWLFSFMWRLIIDWHGALMANQGALYSELKGWEALERWDSSNFCVTSTWQRRSPSIVCWLYVTLFVPWAVFYLLSFFLFLPVKIPGLGLI